MAAYQAERFLPAALDSALGQSHRPLQIIVVDDGSTDRTAEILADYARRHREIEIITQENRGQSAALNTGAAKAQGDYLKFFDADDLLSPDAVALQVSALSAVPRGRLAYGEWARFYTDPSEAAFNPRVGWHDGEPLEWLLATLDDTEPMYQCGLWLVPRHLLAASGGWDARLGLINDFEFFTRLVLASTGVVHTPGARLYYRSGMPGSLSQHVSRKALDSAWLSTRRVSEHLLAREDSPRVRRVMADVFQAFVYAYYPAAPDLMRAALAEVRRLGGSSLRPRGGAAFKMLLRVFGWRVVLRARRISIFLRRLVASVQTS